MLKFKETLHYVILYFVLSISVDYKSRLLADYWTSKGSKAKFQSLNYY